VCSISVNCLSIIGVSKGRYVIEKQSSKEKDNANLKAKINTNVTDHVPHILCFSMTFQKRQITKYLIKKCRNLNPWDFSVTSFNHKQTVTTQWSGSNFVHVIQVIRYAESILLPLKCVALLVKQLFQCLHGCYLNIAVNNTSQTDLLTMIRAAHYKLRIYNA
jgi:hypothetical protein